MDLIFDRTNADVNEARAIHEQIKARGGFQNLSPVEQAEYLAWYFKGNYTALDLNRVESNTKLLNQKLMEYGYGTLLTTKTNWLMTDDFRLADMDRIRANVEYLQNVFADLPEWREIVYNGTMGFEQANTLEWNLHWVDTWLSRMIAAMNRYSGTFYAGEGVIL